MCLDSTRRLSSCNLEKQKKNYEMKKNKSLKLFCPIIFSQYKHELICSMCKLSTYTLIYAIIYDLGSLVEELSSLSVSVSVSVCFCLCVLLSVWVIVFILCKSLIIAWFLFSYVKVPFIVNCVICIFDVTRPIITILNSILSSIPICNIDIRWFLSHITFI